MAQASAFLVRFYIALGFMGFIFTWYHALPYFGNGFLEANRLFWLDGLINANSAGKFLAADVLILALACNIFMFTEGRRIKVRFLYLYILAGLTVAISVAVPVFMAVREATIRSHKSTSLSSNKNSLTQYDKFAVVLLTLITLAACIPLLRN